jgi:hypothetical protein
MAAFQHLYHVASPDSVERFEKSGFKVHTVDLRTVSGKDDLLLRTVDSVPCGDCDPTSAEPWRTPTTWDALLDFLWQGLSETPERKHAIFLLNPEDLASRNSPLLLDLAAAFSVLAD